MHISIYFGNNPMHIYEKEVQPATSLSTVIIENPENQTILDIIDKLKKGELKEVMVVTGDIEKTKNFVLSHFKIIEAAGGIVENENNELLFIFRRCKWDLPKGKIEPSESPEFAAKREIQEETGINEMVLNKKIADTFHYYSGWGEEILKISHWFHCYCKSNVTTTPQIEEDITEIRWFDKRALEFPLSNTYATVQFLIDSFLKTT